MEQSIIAGDSNAQNQPRTQATQNTGSILCIPLKNKITMCMNISIPGMLCVAINALILRKLLIIYSRSQ